MTTIDTLLTLDADDPALQRGIAELLGYHLVDQEEGWIVYPPPDAPREVEDHWHYNRVHLKPEDAWPTAMTMIPDWPHSVDAALELVPDGWDIAMDRLDGQKTWGVYIADAVEVEDPYYVKGTSESTNLALAICRAWLASKR